MADWFKVAVERKYIKLFEYGSFENLEIIGQGGFGNVFRAHSNDIGQVVALKELHNNSTSKNEDSFREFERE
ncbi:7979_t:CDS:1, partial [Dentiscutata heterogama]